MVREFNAKTGKTTERELTASEAAVVVDIPYTTTIEDRVTALEETVAELKSYINSLGKTELVGEGTADNPFALVVGCELVPNAFYNYNGTRYAYMGTAETWDGGAVTEENMFVEF